MTDLALEIHDLHKHFGRTQVLRSVDLTVPINSIYGFLEDLIAAERAISLYPFLEPPTEVDELLDQLEQELGLQP